MKISVSTGLYYTKSYIEILDLIKETSCKNIELFLNQAFIDVPINKLQKEIENRDLNVLSIHTPLEFIAFPRKESEEFWINKTINMAKVFDAKTIVTHMVYGEYFESLPKNLDELHKENILRYKELKDVCVTTENLPYFRDGSFLSKDDEFMRFIENNDINITFDTTHCAASNLSIIDSYKKLKKYIKNIHLSDFNDGAEHKVLGDGQLPLKEFLGDLKKDKFEGTITIEFDFDNKKRNCIENLNQASKEVERSIGLIRKYTTS